MVGDILEKSNRCSNVHIRKNKNNRHRTKYDNFEMKFNIPRDWLIIKLAKEMMDAELEMMVLK